MQVRLVDTTLRDGEQLPGLSFSDAERLLLFSLLKKSGVDAIEIPGPTIDARSADPEWSEPSEVAVIAWNRAVPEDIENSLAAGFRHIHVSLPISEAHIRNKLGKDFAWVLRRLELCIKKIRAANACAYVGAEDASRAGDEEVARYVRVAAEGGAERVRFADTVGRMNPFECYERLGRLQSLCAIPLEFHGHNDFGLAVANNAAACRAGVPWHSGTILGLGERAGNADLSGLVHWLGKIGPLSGFSVDSFRQAAEIVGVGLCRARQAGYIPMDGPKPVPPGSCRCS